jgi:hypothetical protein
MVGLSKSIKNNTMKRRKKQLVTSTQAKTWEKEVFGVGAKRRIILKCRASDLDE